MLTIALVKQLAEDIEDLVLDVNLFCEESPIKPDGTFSEGVWAVSRGGQIQNNPHSINLHSIIDIYVAFNDRVKIETTHRAISEWIQTNRTFCTLSGSVGGIEYELNNIRIRQTSTPQNGGITENGVLVKVASLEAYYDIKNEEVK